MLLIRRMAISTESVGDCGWVVIGTPMVVGMPVIAGANCEWGFLQRLVTAQESPSEEGCLSGAEALIDKEGTAIALVADGLEVAETTGR